MRDFKVCILIKQYCLCLIRLTLKRRKKIVSYPISSVFVVSERELGDKNIFHVTSE